mgnify:CR=1 FL=1
MSIAKRCEHGIEYMYDDYGEAWTDCRKCTPMSNTKPQQECCEECFKWGDKYGEYKHPCHNTDCECHTPQQDTGWDKWAGENPYANGKQQDTWEERFEEKFVYTHQNGEWKTVSGKYADIKDFIAQEKQLSEQQGYQRAVDDVLYRLSFRDAEDTLDDIIADIEKNMKKLSEKKGGV